MSNCFLGGAPGTASFRYGKRDLLLTEAQAVGYENRSVSLEPTALSPAGTQVLIRQFLGF